MSETVDFSAEDVLAAASTTITDLARPEEWAFVSQAAADAWALPAAVQFTFTPHEVPTVVEYVATAFDYESPDRACPVGPALRVPVSLHVSGTLGDGTFDTVLEASGGYALVATAPSAEALSVDFDATDWDLPQTTLDPDTHATLLATTQRGMQCPARAVFHRARSWRGWMPIGLTEGRGPGDQAAPPARGRHHARLPSPDASCDDPRPPTTA